MSAPTLRNAVESHGTASTSIVVTTPTNVAGDLLVVAIGRAYPQNGSLTTLAGWTKQTSADSSQVGAGAIGIMEVYTKISNGSEGASWTWADSVGDAYHAIAAAYSGCDQTTPVDTGGSAQSNNANGTSTTITVTGVTTTHPNATILTFTRHANNSALTACASPSMTKELSTYYASVGTGATISLCDFSQAGAGATGSLNSTIGTTAKSIASTLALNPVLTTPQFWTDFIKCAEVDS